MKTHAQRKFEETFGTEAPARPVRVSNRNWEITLKHVVDGRGFEDLSNHYTNEANGEPLSRERISQIVKNSLRWAVGEELIRRQYPSA